MQVLCPVHKIPLEISSDKIRWLSVDRNIYEGICPKCSVHYTDFSSLEHVSTAKVNGVTYQYLPAIAEIRKAESKALVEAERKRREAEERKKREEEARHAAEKKQKQKKKQEEERRKRVEAQKKKEQQRLQNREEQYLVMVAQYEKIRKKAYRPTFVQTVDTVPSKCPKDGKKLFLLDNVKGKRGHCCLYCNTHYRLNQDKIMPVIHTPKEITASRNQQKIAKKQNDSKPEQLATNKQQRPHVLENLPNSPPAGSISKVLMIVRLSSPGYENRYIAITNDTEVINKAGGVYWYEHRLAEAVMNAVLMNKKTIVYKGETIKIHEAERGASVEINTADKLSRITPVPVYLYSMKHALTRYSVEMVTAQIFFPEANRYIPVAAYYSKRENKYFINVVTFNDYMKTYGLPYVKPYTVKDDGTIDSLSSKLSETSQLKLYGYNVSAQDDYSDSYRQGLLAKLITYKLMTKAQIMSHLEFLIHFHEHNVRYDDAVDKWKTDLRFVRDYNMRSQREVVGRIVPPRR